MTSINSVSSLSGLMTSYWTFNGQMKNNVSGISLWNQHNCNSYVGDRKARARSALYLNNGYAQISVYDTFARGSFSTALWINWLKNSGIIYTINIYGDFEFTHDLKLDSSGVLQV